MTCGASPAGPAFVPVPRWRPGAAGPGWAGDPVPVERRVVPPSAPTLRPEPVVDVTDPDDDGLAVAPGEG